MDSVYGDRTLSGRVSPFGYPRITARFQLPVAFRRSLRPSSDPSAKASPLRSCSLDHTRNISVPSVQSCSNHFWVLASPANCKNRRYLLTFASQLLTLHFAFLFLYSLFKVLQGGSIPPTKNVAYATFFSPPMRFSSEEGNGGLKWTRTTDLTLIRRAL